MAWWRSCPRPGRPHDTDHELVDALPFQRQRHQRHGGADLDTEGEARQIDRQQRRQGLAGAADATLLRDTQMTFRTEGWRFLDLPALGLGRGFLLAAPHLGIGAVRGQQIGVMSAFDDPAAIEHDDLVGIDDGREPVRDDHRRAAAAHLFAASAGFPARCAYRGRWSPRRTAGSPGSSGSCGQSPRAAFHRPKASGRARRPPRRSLAAAPR